jgi:hypothetical protein
MRLARLVVMLLVTSAPIEAFAQLPVPQAGERGRANERRGQPPEGEADTEVAATKPAPSSPPPGADLAALRKQLLEAEARIKALETQGPKPAPERPPPNAAPPDEGVRSKLPRLPFEWALSAYVQAQYEEHEDSQDQLQQGGALLNQDRFSVRRGRIRLDAAWRFAELGLEIDASTTRGAEVTVRRAEASLLYRDSRPYDARIERRSIREGTPPIAMLTLGLSEIPFGFELVDSARDRVFMERTLGSQAFFPSEPDVGLRLSGGISFFRYSLALVNGEPVDDRVTRAGGDPTAHKDFVARVGVDVAPWKPLRVTGGISALRGKGFHPGSDATKGSLVWTDTNENASVEITEIGPAPGSAATPSEKFERWAAGVDLEVYVTTPIGKTMLYGEAALGSNMDRGLFVADPALTSIDVRELALYGALVQQVTPYGLLGFRFDYYDPNADFLESRRGKVLPSSLAVQTYSPVVGLVLPDPIVPARGQSYVDRARLLFQYDVVRDSLGKDTRGVPKELKNDRWTLRLQVQL